MKEKARHNSDIAISDIESAASILFSVLSRYGDSIIAYKVINEFIAQYPDKRYIVITANQTLPYAKAIIKGNVEIHSVNVRRSPIKVLKIVAMLKKAQIDLGFNPWKSWGRLRVICDFCPKVFFLQKVS